MLLLQGLFSTPLPTPSQKGLREDAVKRIEEALAARLGIEEQSLAEGVGGGRLVVGWAPHSCKAPAADSTGDAQAL